MFPENCPNHAIAIQHMSRYRRLLVLNKMRMSKKFRTEVIPCSLRDCSISYNSRLTSGWVSSPFAWYSTMICLASSCRPLPMSPSKFLTIRPPYVERKLCLQRGDSGMKYTPRHTSPGQILDFIQLQYSQMYALELTFEAKEAVATSDYHRCGCLLHKW